MNDQANINTTNEESVMQNEVIEQNQDPQQSEQQLVDLNQNNSINEDVTMNNESQMNQITESQNIWMMCLNYPQKLVHSYNYQEMNKNMTEINCIKQIKTSPCGNFVYTTSDDNEIRIYNPIIFDGWNYNSDDSLESPQSSISHIKEGGMIYDSVWCPNQSILTACYNSSIHLWSLSDAANIEETTAAPWKSCKQTYTAYNHLDEAITAYSIAVDPNSTTFFAGYNNDIHVFDLERGGRSLYSLKASHNPNTKNYKQKGLFSCMDYSPYYDNILAVGSYNGSIFIYNRELEPLSILSGHSHGTTQVQFSRDGYSLFTGGRKDEAIYQYDLRNIDQGAIAQFHRVVNTNQRYQFDLSFDTQYLVTGQSNNTILFYNIKTQAVETSLLTNSDTISCTHFHPYQPLLFTGSGQRHYRYENEEIESSYTENPLYQPFFSIYKLSWNYTPSYYSTMNTTM